MQTILKPNKVYAKPTEKLVKQTVQIQPTPTNKYIKDSVWVNKELQSMIDAAHDNQQIISKTQLFAPKVYTQHQFTNWRTKYESIPSIQNKLKKIEEIIESNLINAGMTKNPAFPIFLLKNHYGYADKREVETNNNFVFNVTRGLPTAHQQRKLVKAQQINK